MSIYSGISLSTLQTWLSEAQVALHALSIGKQVQLLYVSDKRLTFTPADVDKLKRYIAQLQTAIAIAQGQAVGGPASVATWTR